MKFKGIHKTKSGAELYEFVVGVKELEILARLTGQAFMYTPKTFENSQYRSRLGTITKTFAKTYSDSVDASEDKKISKGKRYKDYGRRLAKLLKLK